MSGRWPCQTSSEDAKQGLEPHLAELVTSARDWLIVRGFMSTTGPWVGRRDGLEGGGDSGTGWRRSIVSRTHAAMCTAAILKPGWGSGHQIMGAAEQVQCSKTPARIGRVSRHDMYG